MNKNRYINNDPNKDIEPQQVLLDKLSKEKEKEIGVSERRFEVPLYKNIIISFFIFSSLVFLVLLGQTFNLQFLKGDHYTALAQRNKFRNKQIESLRGVIYSQEQGQLVNNKLNFNLTCKKDVEEKS